VSRRQLTKFRTLTSLAMFAGNLWILLKSWLRAGVSYPMRAVARAGEIPVGGVKLFEYPRLEEQCILVRTSEESYVAYSQKCTHLSCAVTIRRWTGGWNVPATADISQLKTGLCCKGRRPGRWRELCWSGADRNWSRSAWKIGRKDDETIGNSANSKFDGNRRRHGAHYSDVAAFSYA